MPRRPVRRLLALLLAAAGITALGSAALRLEAPLATSLSVARKFWRASPRARVLNSRLFRRDVELGSALIAADRSWPLGWDADLVLPPDTDPQTSLDMRRAAAFLLAPRRVFVSREPLEGPSFALRPRRGPR